MQVQDLIQRCLEVGDGYVNLVMKGKIPAHQNTKRFWGRKGPLGEVVCEYEDGRLMVAFKAKEVLRFIAREFTSQQPEEG